MHPFGITVDVLSTTRDNHGDETTALTGRISGCAFAPSTGTEDNDNRAQVASFGDLYCPATDLTVTAQHRIRLPGGDVWRVVGPPQQWERPYSGGTAGLVLHLERVTG